MLKSKYKLNVFKSIIAVNNKVFENLKNVGTKLEEKVKGTVAENWVKYWKNVLIDYKEVVVDVKKDMIEKPKKALTILSLCGFLTYCAKHNPDSIHFKDYFISCKNNLALVHPSMQNKVTAQHLQYIDRYYNSESIRRLSIGVASIIWVDYYSSSCNNAECNSPHLQVQYKKFKERILDIGFLDKWWILNRTMEDYDIDY